jgi:hypothetical protein
VDVLRPTTAHAMAVVSGEDAGPLLDWLEVSERVTRGGPPDHGLVLLDLPDHDSVRTEHRLEAERLIALVDLMVWVLDPQKYADAAVHERYLRSLTAHRDVLLVVLNQTDRLSSPEVGAAMADVRRLLAEDGLAGVRVLAVSALTGVGIADLRAALDEAAARHEAHRARIEADVITVASRIVQECGGRTPGPLRADRELLDAFAGAAGVARVVDAAAGSYRLAAHLATGWPPTRWLGKLRADPLHVLHLPGSGSTRRRAGPDEVGTAKVTHTSLPPVSPAQAARAAGAIRDWRERATDGLPDAWVLAARARDPGRLADELDQAVARTPVAGSRRPLWWRAVGGVQWLLLAATVAGLGWLGVLAGFDALRLPLAEPPAWGRVPVPTALVVGGIALGLLVAGLARVAAALGARRRARRVTAALRAAVAEVADRLVVAPVAEVVDLLARCRSAAARAAEPPGARRR